MAKKKVKTSRTKAQRKIAGEDRQIAAEAASDETAGQAALDRLYGTNGVGLRTKEEQDILNERKASYEDLSKESESTTSTRKAIEDSVKGVYSPLSDPNIQTLMSKNLSALGGFSAPEMQAQRAQMIRSQQGQTQTALRGMKQAMGSAGVTGGAAAGLTRDVYRSAAIARALGESDLTAKQAEEQDKRLQTANSFASNVGQLALGSESVLSERMNNLSSFVAQSDANRRTSALNSLNAWSQDQLGISAAEREGYMQTYLGGIGLNMARRGALRGEKLGQAGLDLAKQAYAS